MKVTHTHIYIYIHIRSPPPRDRPCPSKHRSHRRVRAFSGVSSLSPPNVSVKNHPTTETKRPKNQSSTENAGTVLFFCFFRFFVFWLFGFIVERVIFSKNSKNQKNKEPKNKEPKIKKQKQKKTKKKQNCSSILRGALVFWSFGFGRRVVLHGHVRRAQTRYPEKSRLILILILS